MIAAVGRALVLSVGLLGVACVHAPVHPHARSSDTAALAGKLIDRNTGLWLAGAYVAVHCTCLAASRETRTDARGSYAFTALPAGRYSIEMRHTDGARHEVVELAPGQQLDLGAHALDPTGTPSPFRICG